MSGAFSMTCFTDWPVSAAVEAAYPSPPNEANVPSMNVVTAPTNAARDQTRLAGRRDTSTDAVIWATSSSGEAGASARSRRSIAFSSPSPSLQNLAIQHSPFSRSHGWFHALYLGKGVKPYA